MRRRQKMRGKKAGVGMCTVSFLFKERNVKAADRLRLTLNGGKTKAEWMEGIEDGLISIFFSPWTTAAMIDNLILRERGDTFNNMKWCVSVCLCGSVTLSQTPAFTC